jgi:uncharacterized protein YjdB
LLPVVKPFIKYLVLRMKKVKALLLASIISIAGLAQVAVDPITSGGFESGGTFAANGWTVVNPVSLSNQWVVSGNAGAFGGVNSAHISNTGGLYQYTLTSAATCHFYRDITLPAGVSSISLQFRWKGYGQAGADRMLAYTAPTSVTPVADVPASPSTTLSGATQIWSQPTFAEAAYVSESLVLPTSLAGTTFRLIFTWQNNATGGTSPGGAIDNISVTYNCGSAAAIIGTDRVCVPGSTSLTTGSPGGTWSSSNPSVAHVSSGGLWTALSAGTSTITYSVAGCPATTRVVTVDGAPTAITGSDSVCTGASATFANSVVGGSWSSGSPTIASVLPGSGLITGLIAGGAYITYTMPAGCYVTRPIAVVDPPTASITGAMEVCPGSNVTLNYSIAGGHWTSLNPGAALIDYTTGQVTGVVADTVRIVYTTLALCNVYTIVTVHPLPVPIVGTSTLCATATTTLYDASPGGTWTSLSTAVATIDGTTGVLASVSAGTALIKYTLPTTCSIMKTITVNALPVVSIGFDGSTNTLFTDSTYSAYQWTHSLLGPVAGGNTYKTAGVFNGSYIVTVTDSFGCQGTSGPFAYNTSMGIPTAMLQDVVVYPNPARNVLHVGAPGNVKTYVWHVDGRSKINGTELKTIDVTDWERGVYLISVVGAAGELQFSGTVALQ